VTPAMEKPFVWMCLRQHASLSRCGPRKRQSLTREIIKLLIGSFVVSVQHLQHV
jgi:hypothetical protein